MINQKKAIFLDRDGVLNKEKTDYVKNPSELEIFPEIIHAIKKFRDDGFLIIVITNQSAINRELTTINQVELIHLKIQHFLKLHETHIDAFYVCPHTPLENCDCRKPKSGLILKAIKENGIDPSLSWMIGDNDSDIIAGKNAGCNTFKITPSKKLNSAAELILQ
jgi:D-glycero-D-manno-heptose 1,7-bisphosphate phosphatase